MRVLLLLSVVGSALLAQSKSEVRLPENEISPGTALGVKFDRDYFVEKMTVTVLPVGQFGSADVFVNGKRVGAVFGLRDKGETAFDVRVRESTDNVVFVGDKESKSSTLKITAFSIEHGAVPAAAAKPAAAPATAKAAFKCNYQFHIQSSGGDSVLGTTLDPRKNSGTTQWLTGDSLAEAVGNACRNCGPGSYVRSVGTTSYRITTSCEDPTCVDDQGRAVDAAFVAQAHGQTLCGNGKAEGHGPVPPSPAAKVELAAKVKRDADLAKSESETQKRLAEIQASRKPIVGTTFQPGPVVDFGKNVGISLPGR